MQVRDIMTQDPACSPPNAGLQEVAKQMVDNDCGEIPIVENGKLVGVVTDRDICCRTVAKGKNPLEMRASDVMTAPAISVTPDASLDEVRDAMESNQIRRVPVVDEAGRCCGIVAQADLATYAEPEDVGEVVESISQPKSPGL
jgi:CBS domain-containing protein